MALEVNELPVAGGTALAMPQVAEQAARGVTNMAVRFEERPAAAGAARLILMFDPPPLAARQVCTISSLPKPVAGRSSRCACRRSSATAARSSPMPTAARKARTAADVERLIWRTTGRLFPDDWQDTYGIRSFFGL